jgi:hypothetical protein
MLGVVSGTSKVFEVIYMLLCYAGPLNGVAALDFVGCAAPLLRSCGSGSLQQASSSR